MSTEKPKTFANLQEIIDQKLGLGKWHVVVLIATTIVKNLAAWGLFSMLFLTPKTDFYCVKWLNDSAVQEVQTSTCYSGCLEYDYDRSVFDNNLIMEFNLICERKWLSSIVQTTFMCGALIGFVTLGWLSDRFGRRPMISLSLILYAVTSTASCFVSNYWLFIFLRWLVGIGTAGIMSISFVILIESTPTKYRDFFGCVTNFGLQLGSVTMPAYAYFLRSWNTYLLGLSVTSCIYLLFIFVLPETLRWLVIKGKYERAVKLMESVGRWNNIKIDEDVKVNLKEMMEKMKTETGKKNTSSYIDLINNRKTLLRSTCVMLLGLTNGLSYYGLYQYMGLTVNDIFLSATITGFALMPSSVTSIFLNKYIGRKFTTVLTLTITGAGALSYIFVPEDHWAKFILLLIALNSGGNTVATLYIYASELFPTSVRNMAVGVLNVGYRAGGMMAPFVAYASPDWLPCAVFTTLSLSGALTCLLLPESRGVPMKDQFERKK